MLLSAREVVDLDFEPISGIWVRAFVDRERVGNDQKLRYQQVQRNTRRLRNPKVGSRPTGSQFLRTTEV